MYLPISDERSHTGKKYHKDVGIDRCIAPVIKALNEGGIETVECCCGHGKCLGYIALADGRVLVPLADKEAWDKFRYQEERP
jgi:hypothetical protein